MLAIEKGRVTEVIKQRSGLTKLKVELENGEIRSAINYNNLTGEIEVEDEVILNTTAVELELGTGGNDFVICVMDNKCREITDPGHIMKLRYSPFQIKCLSVEEKASQYREQIKNFTSLEEHPVIIGSLHSVVAPVTMVLDKLAKQQLKIAYIMTDGAALPLKLSNTIDELQNKDLLKATITVGHAFGGDLEAVNIYSGLIAAKEVVEADVTIVAMGPGIVGTGTKYGSTGLEQGEIINAVKTLEGVPIAIPRVSFSDHRERHYGLSHHSLTVLDKIALEETIVGLPKLAANKHKELNRQLTEFNLDHQHDIKYRSGEKVIEIIDKYDIEVNTMGRDEKDDPEFFMTAGIAGILALEQISFSSLGSEAEMNSSLTEERLKSTEIYEGRILNLRVDDVKLPNGTETKREIIEHADGVTIIPYLSETEEVIMVRQFRNPMEKILLELPAGMLEVNEEVKKCARRELEEETGYRTGDLKRIGSFYTSPGFCDEKIHLYLAQDLSKYKQRTDGDEFIEIVNMKVSDLKEKLYSPEIIDAKTIIGIQYLLEYLDS